MILLWHNDIDLSMHEKILKVLSEANDSLSVMEITKLTSMPYSTVADVLVRLKDNNILDRKKKGKCTHYFFIRDRDKLESFIALNSLVGIFKGER